MDRLPPKLRHRLQESHVEEKANQDYLPENAVHLGDSRQLLKELRPNSVALSVWSPPYFVGKSYEKHMTFGQWQMLLSEVINLHFDLIKPGGFLAINIADILVFRDEHMPQIQADVVSRKKVKISKEDVLRAQEEFPEKNRYELAKLLGCSEQTIDRRLNGNNIRGGKSETQTRVKIVGGLVEEWALRAGFYTYDRRIWVKDAAWESSQWASLSYRAVDEFEYIYVFWKPGITRVDRERLTREEWSEWGSRAVWYFPSVRANDDHEAKFPLELPTRIIRLLTDPEELVLDCFMGSGTTAVAAIRSNRNYIGIELDPTAVTLAQKNIDKEKSRYVAKPLGIG